MIPAIGSRAALALRFERLVKPADGLEPAGKGDFNKRGIAEQKQAPGFGDALLEQKRPERQSPAIPEQAHGIFGIQAGAPGNFRNGKRLAEAVRDDADHLLDMPALVLFGKGGGLLGAGGRGIDG